MRRMMLATMIGGAGLVLCSATSAHAQKTRKCSGSEPDSSWMLLSPVYRDCDVDKPAKMRGSPPRLNYQPSPSGMRDQCWVAAFEFVIDTTGRIEPTTVLALPGNDVDLQEAVMATFDRMKWEPAKKDGQPVRQLHAYRMTAGVVVRAVQVSSGRPGSVPIPPGPPPRAPKC